LQKRWNIVDFEESESVKNLTKELGVSNFISQLLHQRGIDTFNKAKSFFRPTLDELHDPFLMKDMDKAVARILSAIDKGEKILVYGDYDVDGTTAVSLMYSFLKTIYDKLEYYIPNRYTEGYGVSFQGIDYAHENNFSLIIALDCGIKAIDKVDYANKKNIDFIICDHHRPGDKLPKASAVLDPKRNDCDYPYKELCGCGVGFKLVQAIATTKKIPFSELEQYFDLLVISIASDIVPITGENRILAHYGLIRVNENPRKGIAEILKISSNNKELNITGLVFTIGPRINAAGRMQSGMNAVKLLVSDNDFDSQELSKFIEQENADRKDLDRNITEEALDIVASNEALINAKSSVLYNKDWHKGVIGIVASRLIENYYRPTIILTESNGVAAGSARSVFGFDVYNAIDACSYLLTQFGGHMYAAGLTMPIENIPAFQQKFEEVVSSTITPEQLIPEIKIDSKIDFHEIKNSSDYGLPKFYRVLKQFAPFGPQNMTPTFMTQKAVAKWVKIVGETHLKFTAYQESNPTNVFACIAFGMSDFYNELASGKEFSFVYNLEENTWNGNTSLQLMVRDIKVDDPS
jgi:single-stranded-DNA-specific exonuclease